METITTKTNQCHVCNGRQFEKYGSILKCTCCNTIYNLETHKMDRTQTMVSPLDCTHWHKRHICGMEGSNEQEHVSICLDCGSIFVYAVKGGVKFSLEFTLLGDDAVEAAGKFNTLVKTERRKD